jgi:hypothetical protein
MTFQAPLVHLLVGGLVLVAVLFGLGLLARAIKARLKPSQQESSYALNASLVTPAERSFLGSLDAVLSPEIRVFAKVRLADIFSVKGTRDRAAWKSAFNRIQSKHVDFILCRADDLSILLAIELDDKSHGRSDRQARDVFLDGVFATSPIRLIRVEAKRTYNIPDLSQTLSDAMRPR